MPVTMYSIYIGNYESPSKAKNDIVKINALGLKAYTFSRGNHYALKVFASPNKEAAEIIYNKFKKLGYVAEFEELALNNH